MAEDPGWSPDKFEPSLLGILSRWDVETHGRRDGRALRTFFVLTRSRQWSA